MNRIYRFVYDVLFHLALPFVAIAHWKNLRIFANRLAFYPSLNSSLPVIWFHGSSVGEVLTLIPLMQKMQQQFPHTQILSVSTPRGERTAKEKGINNLIYLPLDISYIINKALKKICPKMIIIVETEIWPNLFWQCTNKKVPVFIVSGRISPRSFPRYRALRFFFADVIRQAQLLLMQSSEDATRIVEVGAKKEKVFICGNLKHDRLICQLNEQQLNGQQKLKDFGDLTLCLVAGSTHQGEEQAILDAFLQIKKSFPKASLVIAPRHLERLLEVEAIVKNSGLSYVLRSKLPANSAEVIVLDTYGELTLVYSLADIAFVGGSLIKKGGHNVMEPAVFGKPVLFGPYTSNCRKDAQKLLECQAALRVSFDDLERTLLDLFENPEQAQQMGQNGQKFVFANQGATDKVMEHLTKYI